MLIYNLALTQNGWDKSGLTFAKSNLPIKSKAMVEKCFLPSPLAFLLAACTIEFSPSEIPLLIFDFIQFLIPTKCFLTVNAAF